MQLLLFIEFFPPWQEAGKNEAAGNIGAKTKYNRILTLCCKE